MSSKIKDSGFSLIEAMIATLILGISIAGVFTMSGVSSVFLKNSIDRQKMQLVANQILESIDSDYASIDNYNNMDFTTCVAPTGTQTQTYHQNRYKWCRMLNDAVGTSVAGDTRKITITTSGTSKIVSIVLESHAKNAQIVIKNVYD